MTPETAAIEATFRFKFFADNFEYLIVPILIYYGYITAFGDLKTGKIPNRLIGLGVIIGLIWFVVETAFWMWFYKTNNIQLFPEGMNVIFKDLSLVGFNTLIALAVGFFMWWVHLWAAGDAKLFAVFAFITPIDFYEKFHVSYFPSFVLLFRFHHI